MLTRKITVVTFMVTFISVILLPCTTYKKAEAADEQYQALIGEWSAVWPGDSGDRSTIIIHEIDVANSKAQITYVVDLADEGHKEYKIIADFISDPSPTLKFNARDKDFTCILKRGKLDVSLVGNVRGVQMSNVCKMEKRPQIFSQVDELLEKNPLPAGKKAQAIKIAEDDTVTILLIRQIEGAGLKPHFHKTHNETLYVIKGAGQLLVNDKWVDLKPGSVHFNPMGKTHASKQIGAEPYVAIAIFTPGMKEPDRQFVE